MKRHALTHAVAAAVIVFAVSGCSGRPVVSITNASGADLHNVLLSGSGFSERIESLSAGAHRSFSPPVRGESGLRVEFDAAGEHHDSGEQDYFEAGQPYRVSVTVDAQMKITVDSKLH